MCKCHDFSVTQILHEINFEESRNSTLHYCNFRDSANGKFGRFQPSKSAENHKTQNPEPLKLQKWQISYIQNHQN